MAMMTLLMIATMAAAPSLQLRSRREREREAIARGEEVAEAIRRYIHAKRQPPTSMDDLLEGVEPFPGAINKVQILRASAARDPLSRSGEWRLIKVNDRDFIEFIRRITLYADGVTPPTNDKHPAMTMIAAPFAQLTGIVDIDTDEEAPGDEDSSASSSGPFIGVASRSRRASVIVYYGIERHDKWVFTPFFR